MKLAMASALLVVHFLLAPLVVFAQDASTAIPSRKTTIELQSFDNKNTAPLGAKWEFLKDPDGPLTDAVSNGLLQQLSRTLQDRTQITVTGLGREARAGTVMRGVPGANVSATLPASETPRFVVSCSATMSGDTVTIEVRLTDPQTKKLISATKVEGRPEDLNQEIRERFRDGAVGSVSGGESPAEKAVRAAIMKAVAWIGQSTLDAVVVKASMTRVKEAPSLQSPTLITVRQGTRMQKIGTEGQWLRIRLESGEVGWVYREVVD